MTNGAVIPASETRRESSVEKDSGQAGMTIYNFDIRHWEFILDIRLDLLEL